FGLFKQAVPKLSRPAALLHPNAYGKRTMEGILKETEVASQATGAETQIFKALGPNDIEGAFSDIASSGSDGVIVMPSPMLYSEHRRIVELAVERPLTWCIGRPEAKRVAGMVKDQRLVLARCGS